MPLNNISATCPISTRRVDTNMVRSISFQVALLTVIFLVTEESFFALVLLFDFMMRTLRLFNFSPFHLIAQLILSGWGIAPQLSDESPKRFALYLGLGISLLLVLLMATGFMYLATFIAILLLICATLETAFDFCIGCKIYYTIQMLKGILSARNIK